MEVEAVLVAVAAVLAAAVSVEAGTGAAAVVAVVAVGALAAAVEAAGAHTRLVPKPGAAHERFFDVEAREEGRAFVDGLTTELKPPGLVDRESFRFRRGARITCYPGLSLSSFIPDISINLYLGPKPVSVRTSSDLGIIL